MITIVDYNAGNLRSVKRACDAVGLDSQLSQDPDEIAQASKIIFPGVGAAKAAMNTLHQTGLVDALNAAMGRGTPILGICVGCQIILDHSEEGNTQALGLIPGETVRFELSDPRLKIPHMGWNQIQVEQPHPLLEGMKPDDEMYFVHSFYPDPTNKKHVFATCEYEKRFCCALGQDNLFATQFHPEKSGRLGLEMLKRFASWEGTC